MAGKSDVMSGSTSSLLNSELENLKKYKDTSVANTKKIHDIETANMLNLAKKKLEEDKKIEEALHQAKLVNIANESGALAAGAAAAGDKLKDKLKEAADNLSSGKITQGLTKQLDTIIDNYISAQERLSAHLVGSGNSLSGVIDNLNSSLSTTSLVKQEAVYNNLSKLVSAGITYNVEQRAFLQTLSDDLGMVFDANNGTLTQLIRLQTKDLSSNRMAIEYSLQEFLNQNYNTSEYIQKAFTDVSDSLIEMQSLVSSSQAVALETDIQTWLGQYYSAGMNQSTVTALANAINELGSGDISNLGKGISNLVLMGVSRSNLDYGSLLTNGLTSSDVNSLMTGITSYLQEMSGYGNNVVKSQLAELFGVNIADLRAIQNVGGQGTVSSDIYSTVLSDLTGLVPFQTQISNALNNAMFTWGTSVAGDTTQYILYQAEKLLSSSGIGSTLSDIGGIMSNSGAKISGSLLSLAGTAINNAPLLSLFTSGAFGNIISSLSSLTNGTGISGVFNSLGAANNLGSTVKVSSSGVSGSMYMSIGDTSELISGANSSLGGFTDALQVEAENTVEPVDLIREDVAQILSILNLYMEGISSNLSTISESVSYSQFGQLTGGN